MEETNNKYIAITGGIACGKSAICHYLKQKGHPVISFDVLAHEIYEKDVVVKDGITKHFGRIMIKHGSIDRRLLGKIVFNDKEAMDVLNSMMLHRLRDAYHKRKAACEDLFWNTQVIVEAPTYFEAKEAGMKLYFDSVVAVFAGRKRQVDWQVKRGLSRAEAEARIDAQMSIDLKCQKANHLIHNCGDLSSLHEATDKTMNLIQMGINVD